MEKGKKLIVIAIIGLLVIIAGVFLIQRDSRGEQQVSMEEPIDVVLNFYESWLLAAQATSTDPYKEGLQKDAILGEGLVDKLVDLKGEFKDGTDPVLCQTAVPLVLSSRVSYILDDEAQILVLARDEGFSGQSVATLTKLNDGWYISDISCSAGEFGEEREFSFEKDGYILKSAELGGVYVIFEENGIFGSVAPLVFSSESMCTSLDGDQSTCNPDALGEKTPALIRGQMSEVGVDVQQIEFVKEGELSFE